ncbi:hypothetical protein P3T35_003074 [Kitasatospora sp. GP30]|uniref:hypothetical protein n=1 Tax=Kitasatospora sp. GP30 TaxID=3035084 RepID=UPI000C701F99|nr:hypothetical protein [Kitasatospora sp. GP30]MDH6141061.1 hypothetical protein [Kitasatospora sp. GP30]
MYLLMSGAPRVGLRSTISNFLARTAVRIAQAPAPVQLPAQRVEQQPEATADFFTPADMPAVEDIEAAAAEYQRAAEQARRADRGKRAARKILDRLPAGSYGRWLVERVSNNRQVADLDTIRATYKRLGLGPVPMKQSAPSLKVTQLADVETPAEFKVLAGVAL